MLTAARAKAKSGPTLEELSERVRAAPQKDGGVVVVTATGASGAEAANPVSYTHLDVYKRQAPRTSP